MTRITDDNPAIAPSLISEDIQPRPARSATTALGSGTLSSLEIITRVAIADTMMYNRVQMSSDPMMPIGMSRCGFLASCAAVLTASNPMYAKKTIAAPVKTPLHPNSPATGTPSLTVCGGMNGCQLAGLTAWAANTMNSSTTATFTNTMMLLKFADSLIPMTSSVVTRPMMITAGRLKIAVAVVPSGHCTATPRAAERAQGTLMPTSCRNDTT